MRLSEPAIRAEDDEPAFVREYHRKIMKNIFLVVLFDIAMITIGHLSGNPLLSSALFWLALLAIVPFGLWYRRTPAPVRAWYEEMAKKHRVVTKEDEASTASQQREES
jgi:hypothetical protein